MKKRMTSLLTAIAAVASILQPAVPVASADAVGIPGWTYTTGGNSGAACSLDSKFYCYGSNSVKLSGEASGNSVTLKTDVLVEQGKTYNVSFWAKSIETGTLSFAIGNSKYSLIALAKSYDWTKFSYKYTHQDNSTTVPVVFELKNQGVAYIDGVIVSLDEKGKTVNLVANSGFEEIGTVYISDELAEYSQTDMSTVLESFADKRAMPVLWGEDIKVDGDVSEWSGYPVVALPQKNKSVDTVSGYTGAEDVSVDFMTAYDDEYLYLHAEVTDNVHSQENEASTYWRGDSIQLALSTAQEDYGMELGFYLTDGGESKVYSAELEKTEWGAVDPKVLALREKTVCKAYREGIKTFYEIAIPWAIKFDAKPQQFMLNLLINDNDGSGRKGYIEWNDGIGKTKSNEKFAVIFPIENNSDVFAYIDGEKSILEHSSQKYHLYIYNNSDVEKSIGVRIDGAEVGDVTVSAKSVYLLPFEVNTGDAGNKTITAELIYDRNTYKTTRVVPIKMDLKLALPAFGDNQLKELKDLVAKCAEKGIKTDYENITLATIESFIDYGLEDYNGGRESRAVYVYECLVDLYNEAKASLTSYLDGTSEPKNAVYYQSSDLEFKNKAIYGDTVNVKTGEVKRAPVFLSGYLDATRESYNISQFGATMLQFELPMSGYVGSSDSVRGWNTNRQGGVIAEYSYDENSYKGNYSLKISNSSELKSNVYTNLSQKIALEGGKQYTLSFYAKGESANGCSFRPDGWKTSKISISGTYDWRKITYDYKPEEDCEVELMFMSEDTTGGFYLDNIRLVEKGTNVNLIKHGSFEELPVVINGYSIDVDRVQRDVITALDKAEKNNVAVDILMSVHYFPEKLLPEEEWKANQIGFVKHNLYNDKVQEINEAFFRGVIPLIANHKALSSICISNEPTFRAGLDESNTPKWHEYLRGVYNNDVAQMNRVWHENYANFEDVVLSTEYENPAMYYDYLRFNDRLFADWHKKIADIVKELAPDVPVHSKMMSVVEQAESSRANFPLVRGTDPELFAEFSDMGGNDSWNFIGSSRTMTLKSLWYDLLTSIKNVPVFNSEDHVVEDRDERYTPEYAPHYATDLWQGAIHGRSAMAMWKWARTLETTNSTSGNITHRPDAVALEGHTMLDLNRLGKEVEAIQNIKPEVAVMYSYPSRVHGTTHMNAVYKTYEALGNAGQRTKIVTEKMIADGQLEGIKLLAVPNVESTDAAAIEGIKTFVENGGKVLLIGNCFLYDEYKNAFANTGAINYITSNSRRVAVTVDAAGTHITTDEDINAVIRECIKSALTARVDIVDSATGAHVLNTEWCYIDYDSALLINLCLFERSASRNVTVMLDGVPVAKAKDLRSGRAIESTFSVNGYEPMLIRIEK